MTRTTLPGSTLGSLSDQLGPRAPVRQVVRRLNYVTNCSFLIRARRPTRDEAAGLHGLPYLSRAYGSARRE